MAPKLYMIALDDDPDQTYLVVASPEELVRIRDAAEDNAVPVTIENATTCSVDDLIDIIEDQFPVLYVATED